MSYLDLAAALARGDFHAVLNPLWSPLYVVSQALCLRLFRPSLLWKIPAAHFVNLLIFVVGLATFDYFWRAVMRLRRTLTTDHKLPEWVLWLFGYSLFAVSSLDAIKLGLVNPDLLVCVIVYLVAGIALRISVTPSGLGPWVGLGAALAVGYFAKATFFPLAFVFFSVTYLASGITRHNLVRMCAALLTFAVLVSPLVAALSHAQGRLTFGESARLNWAWYFNDVPHYRHWQGGPAGFGEPVHPTRKLLDHPELYEFGTPVIATYPPWFNPSYWYEGIAPRLNLRRQVAIFVRNAGLTLDTMLRLYPAIFCCLGALLCMTGGLEARRRLSRVWPLAVAGITAIAMFCAVHSEPRYLGPWIVLVLTSALLVCEPQLDDSTQRTALAVLLSAVLTTAAFLGFNALRNATTIEFASGRSTENVQVALALQAAGVRPGDQLALVGDGDGAYWGYLLNIRIIAEVPASFATRPVYPAMDFWVGGVEQQARVIRTFEKLGVRAIVAESMPSMPPPGWLRIGNTSRWVYWLQPNRPKS
jgi:hypothetical protein